MKSDQEILDLLKRGEEEGIECIFTKYYESLCLYAESILRDHAAAEEVVEDFMVSVWLKAKTLQIYASLKNYLFRSIHNNCIKYLNKKKVEKEFLEKYAAEDRAELFREPQNSQFVEMITDELREKASQVIDTLPENCREIYLLSRDENLSYPEIARKLGISVGTVKTQMSRAFHRLRDQLTEFL